MAVFFFFCSLSRLVPEQKKKTLFPDLLLLLRRGSSVFLARHRHAPRPPRVVLRGGIGPGGAVWTSQGADNNTDGQSAIDINVFCRGGILLFCFESAAAVRALDIEGRMLSLD